MNIKDPERAWQIIEDMLLDDEELTIEELDAELRAFGCDVDAINRRIEEWKPKLEAITKRYQSNKR